MAPKIPDRWLDYKPIGEVIKGTRFIAFKVPLREHVVQSISADIRLNCSSLLSKIPDLGMIIDLTNTLRYYDPNTFRDKGIVYEKLMIPGRQLPERKFVERFNMLVNNFLQENANNAKLIGVHCTHGVNRTGYLISNFMISKLKISPTEAIKRVEEARGHAIERLNYRDHLLGISTIEPAGSHPDRSHRLYNNLANPNTRSNTYSNNNRQSYTNYTTQTDRSLPDNRYYYDEWERSNNYYLDRQPYENDESQYYRHQERSSHRRRSNNLLSGHIKSHQRHS